MHANHNVIRRSSARHHPGLSALITKHIGERWSESLAHELAHLEPLADDPGFQGEWQAARATSKQTMAGIIRHYTGVAVDPGSLFDVQLKPVREDMRQLLNVLHVVTLYGGFTRNPGAGPPRTVIFAGKVAAGDITAKLIAAVASVTNGDVMVAGRLKVVLLPEVAPRVAQLLCRAADVSEQLSIARSESGNTDNLKLAMKGAITIGAAVTGNLALRDAVGHDNIFLFGRTGREIDQAKPDGCNPHDTYDSDPYLREAIDLIRQGFFSRGVYEIFLPLLDSLLTRDQHMVLADYQSYVAQHQRVSGLYRHASRWTRTSILNSIRAGGGCHLNASATGAGQHARL